MVAQTSWKCWRKSENEGGRLVVDKSLKQLIGKEYPEMKDLNIDSFGYFFGLQKPDMLIAPFAHKSHIVSYELVESVQFRKLFLTRLPDGSCSNGVLEAGKCRGQRFHQTSRKWFKLPSIAILSSGNINNLLAIGPCISSSQIQFFSFQYSYSRQYHQRYWRFERFSVRTCLGAETNGWLDKRLVKGNDYSPFIK